MRIIAVLLTSLILAQTKPCPAPVPTPSPIPTPSPTPEPTPTPTPEPTPIPTPSPTPIPIPPPDQTNPNFPWKDTNAPPPEACSRKDPSNYLWAVDIVFGTGVTAQKPRDGENEIQFYARLSPGLWARGYSTAIYGEELAVQNDEGFSENFDRVLSSGEPRWGFGSYRSTCKPASLSQRIGPTPTPTPTSTPTPDPSPTPIPTPTPACAPFNPAQCPELKSISARLFNQVGKCTKILDSTPSQDTPPRHRPLGPECGETDACCKQINQRGVCENKYGPYKWIFSDPSKAVGCPTPGIKLVPNPLQIKVTPSATVWVKAKNGVESNRIRVNP